MLRDFNEVIVRLPFGCLYRIEFIQFFLRKVVSVSVSNGNEHVMFVGNQIVRESILNDFPELEGCL